MTTHRMKVPGFLIADYRIREVKNPAQLIVLLHGYSETGTRIFEKLQPVLPQDAVVVAPNGPFPIPERGEKGYSIGFSWYFYDPFTDQYFIDMELAVTYLKNFLSELKLDHLPVSFIGFSQGGYLAPFVALQMKNACRVVGIACEFLSEEILQAGKPVSFTMDSIHGADDAIVDASQSAASHAKLKALGVKGDFYLVGGVGHRISSGMRALIAGIFA